MLAFGMSADEADKIIELKKGADKIAGTKDDLVFYNVVDALGPESPIKDYFTTKSNYFRIESRGMIDRSKINSGITCVLDKGAKKLIYYREY